MMVSNISCALSARLGREATPVVLATRTSYPTFTPTQPVPVTLPVVSTDTPVPPTATPEPPPTETVAPPTPEPAPTDTPVPEPTAAPPPAPTQAPPPEPPQAEQPPAPAEPGVGPHGVIGRITLRDQRDTYGSGEQVFVKIEVINKSSGTVPFGVLGLTGSNGEFHTSYTDHQVDIGSTFNWEDGMPFSAPGSYTMWLSVCFSSRANCESGSGDWERFEPGVNITVQ